MSAMVRPEREIRSAQREGRPASAKGRAEGEARSGQRVTTAMRAARLPVVALALLQGACVTTPVTPRPDVEVPAIWRGAVSTAAVLSQQPWSRVFGDPALEALIRDALAANSDLRVAAERVELARAQYAINRSTLFPTLAGDASWTRQRGPSFASATDNTVGETSSLRLALPGWEIDVWGRLRSQSEAARRQWLASEQNRRALYISLVAEVATGYLQLVGFDDQLAVAYRTAETRLRSRKLVEARNRAGVASGLEVRQAEILVANARQTIADLERQRQQTENALSALAGRNPGSIARNATSFNRPLPLELPAGIPSALLDQRPDLIAAEENLRAAALDVDAARKAFLPTISLTGFLGFVSPELRNLVEGGRYAWSAQPAITLPLFTAGRLQANVEATEAAQRIAVEQYRQAVRNAFRDVEDALAAYRGYREQRDALASAVGASRERLRLTDLRYVNGVSSYFEVLDSQRELFELELALSQATRAVYASVVQFYRSLGGGWDPAYDPTLAPDASVPSQ